MRSTLILSLLFFFWSCAQKPEEKIQESIDLAQTYLSENECQKAIDLLADLELEDEDPIFVQVFASAYACRAGFDEISFLEDDIADIDTSSGGFLTSLSILSKSYESEADSDSYTDLLQGINVILEAGGGAQPSQVDRNAVFGPSKAGDMGLQALYMSIVQLGKFLNFYGNVDTSGNKGGGAASTDEQGATASTCFITYSYATAVTYLQTSGASGVCNNLAVDIGHPDLSLASLTTTKSRMCEGLVLFTNIIDILNNVTLPESDSLDALNEVVDTVNDFKDAAITRDSTLETLLETTSQSECETLVATSTNFDSLQYIYALLFETGLP